MNRLLLVRRVSALLLLSLWWGGFTFYAGRVVFIGHEILRSTIRQGFITERVTNELNWLGNGVREVNRNFRAWRGHGSAWRALPRVGDSGVPRWFSA